MAVVSFLHVIAVIGAVVRHLQSSVVIVASVSALLSIGLCVGLYMSNRKALLGTLAVSVFMLSISVLSGNLFGIILFLIVLVSGAKDYYIS